MASLKYLDPITGEYKKVASGGGGTSIPASDTEPATGNYWLDTSEEGGTYYTAGEVDNMLAALPAGVQMDLLWENPNPQEVFASQTLAVNSTDYDLLLVLGSYDTTEIRLASFAFIEAKTDDIRRSHLTLSMPYNSASGYIIGTRMMRRLDNENLEIWDNEQVQAGSYTASFNNRNIPYRIYGIKSTVTGGTSVTPENVYTKDEIDELLANVGGGTSMNLLWTNPDPTAEFGAQHVYLDLSEYSLLFFRFLRFYRDGHHDGYQTVIGMKGKEMIATTAGAISSTQDSAANNAVAARRYINSSDEFVYFDPGVRDQASNISSADNRCMIPVEIYGIKTVAANGASEIEDPDHPGCFYRTVNGVREWLNPPMELGVEYKTTERYVGKPVYALAFDYGALPNTTHRVAYFPVAENVGKIIDYGGEGAGYVLPNVYPTTGYDIKLAVCLSSSGGLAVDIGTDRDYSAYNATVWAKYTKTTD